MDIYLGLEAWALNADSFLTTVLDVLQNGDTRLAMPDGSAACHMPRCSEMPACVLPFLGGEPGRMLLPSVLEDQPACPGMLIEIIASKAL